MNGRISRVFVEIGTKLDKLRAGLVRAQGLIEKRTANWAAHITQWGERYGGVFGKTIASGIGKAVSTAGSQIAASSLSAIGLGAAFGVAAAGAASVVASLGGIYLATKSSVRAASDLNETIAKTHTLLGSQVGADVENFAKGLQNAGKVGARQAMESVVMVANSLVNRGTALTKATGLGKQLTELAADIASQDNRSVDEVLEKIRSGLAGESEPLRALGIYIGAEEAQKAGKNFGEYAAEAILKQGARASGDLEKTSGSLANLQRTNSIYLEAAMEKLGKSFLVFNQIIESAKARFYRSLSQLAESPAMERLGLAAARITASLTNLGAAVGPYVIDVFVWVAEKFAWVMEQVARASQLMENYLVAPANTVGLVLMKLALTISETINNILGYVNRLTGGNLQIDTTIIQKKIADYQQNIQDAGGYKSEKQIKAFQDFNKQGFVENPALQFMGGGAKTGEVESKRTSFASLLENVVGGADSSKKYQADMLAATKQIAENTKPASKEINTGQASLKTTPSFNMAFT